MEELLESGNEVSFVPSGSSMLPLIHGSRDRITLKKPTCTLKKYDVPLYRRKDGAFVLHRIIGIGKNGYIMCGDHQTQKEYPISDEDIIAVMVSLERNGRHIDCGSKGYKLYSRVWTFIRPIRPFVFACASIIFKIRSKIFGT